MRATWMIARKYRVWLLLGFGTLLYFFANLQRVAIPGSIFNELQMDLNVTAFYVTGLGSAFMFIYAVSHLLVGVMVDRYGGFSVISWGAGLFCLGALLFPFSDSLAMLYFSRAVVGIGASTLWLSMVKETSLAFPKNFTLVFGVVLLLGYMGGVVANAPFIMCVNEMGWRMVLKIIASVMCVAYVCFLAVRFTLPKPKVRPVPLSLTPYWALLKKRHNLHLFAFSGLNFSLYYVLQTVLGKKFLEDFAAMSPEMAAMILSTMGIISGLANFSVAALSRLCGNRRRIFVRGAAIGSLSMYLTITALVLCNVHTAWIALCFLLLTSTSNISPITVSLVRETNDPGVMGAAVSCSNMIAYGLVALLGNLSGVLMDLFLPEKTAEGVLIYTSRSYMAVFCTLSLLSLFAFYNAWKLRETRGEMCVVQ